MTAHIRDHGGRLDAAAMQYGGDVADWIDLSTGINPVTYPVCDIAHRDWSALPDARAQAALASAARVFWNVPDAAALIATPGASAPIALIPHLLAGRLTRLRTPAKVHIAAPTYNEHAAAFAAAGWQHAQTPDSADAQVIVHPNNPDGRVFSAADLHAPLRIIDESFCDVMPDASLLPCAATPGTLVLKSFGKFWGLAGVRLGFAVGDPELIGRLEQMLGPWPVSGPALAIGTAALRDADWAAQTRRRLHADAARLDDLMQGAGATCVGGTALFRLYDVADAARWQDRLASHRIWSRVFPYSTTWLRLGLPAPDQWDRIRAAVS